MTFVFFVSTDAILLISFKALTTNRLNSLSDKLPVSSSVTPVYDWKSPPDCPSPPPSLFFPNILILFCFGFDVSPIRFD